MRAKRQIDLEGRRGCLSKKNLGQHKADFDFGGLKIRRLLLKGAMRQIDLLPDWSGRQERLPFPKKLSYNADFECLLSDYSFFNDAFQVFECLLFLSRFCSFKGFLSLLLLLPFRWYLDALGELLGYNLLHLQFFIVRFWEWFWSFSMARTWRGLKTVFSAI